MPNVFWRKGIQPSSLLKVGQLFIIDRKLINQNLHRIWLKCFWAGFEGIELWKRLKSSNEIANRHYPTSLGIFIFPYNGEPLTEQGMRQKCKEIGDGMCDEIMCDLVLMMLICRGVSVRDLVKRNDWLPYSRAINRKDEQGLEDVGTGYWGGGANHPLPHSSIFMGGYYPEDEYHDITPCAYCVPDNEDRSKLFKAKSTH